MKWWEKLIPFSNRKATEIHRAITQMFHNTAVWTPANYESLAKEGYEKNIWVYKCVSIIAQTCANLPILLYSKQGKNLKEIEEHELVKLLEHPNEFQSKEDFFEHVIAFLLLSGNSYIDENGPNTGPPKELWSLRPDRINILPDNINYIKGYRYTVNGVETNLPRERVAHIKFFSPTEDFYGLGPIQIASRGIDMDNMANAWNVSLLQNGARPSGAMVTPEFLPDKQYNDLKDEIKKMMGRERVGRPMLLEGGLQWVEMGLSPKDMDFIESKKISRLEICSAFGVPPEIVGDKEHATYSNYQEARKSFYEETCIPLMEKVLGTLNNHLVRKFGDNLFLAVDLDNVEAIQTSLTEIRKEAREDLKAGAITLNEYRQAIGYEDTEGGNVRFMPLGVAPVGEDEDYYLGMNPEPELEEEEEEEDETDPKKEPKKKLNFRL